MKIGIFTECYEPVINGVVHSIDSTKKGLEDLGHEVFVFTPDYKEKNLKDSKVIPCPSFPIGRTSYHFIYKLQDKIKKIAKELDVYHTHHPFLMGRRAQHLAGEFSKPVLFTYHTQYDQYLAYVPLFKHLAGAALKNYLKKFCDRCTQVIAPSEGIAEVIKKYGTKSPIEVVHNGIAIERFAKKNLSEPKALEALPKNRKIVLYTGRIAYEKNIDFLVRSFAKTVQMMPNAYLVLVGSGAAEKEIKNLAADLKIEKNMIMTGAVKYDEIPAFYEHADIFSAASKTDVHPLIALEAIAAGLPVVAVKAIGFSDIVKDGETGFLTNEQEKEFAQKIVKLLDNNSLRERMSRLALKDSKNYSIHAAAQNMFEAYKKAISLIKSRG